MSDHSAALRSAIEALYQCFASHPVSDDVKGCPCCVKPEGERELTAAPLRAIPTALLDHYAFKAMTTWGTPADFRHFVPAIWDQLTRGQLLTNTQIIYGKLPYADYREWPESERLALQRVTEAWFDVALDRSPHQLTDIIESAGLSGLRVEPLIERVDARTRDPHDAPAAELLAELCASLNGTGRIEGAWWTDPEQRLSRWLVAHAFARLEAAVLALPEHPDATYWLDMIPVWTAYAEAGAAPTS